VRGENTTHLVGKEQEMLLDGSAENLARGLIAELVKQWERVGSGELGNGFGRSGITYKGQSLGQQEQNDEPRGGDFVAWTLGAW
jgi:hypothetical protein